MNQLILSPDCKAGSSLLIARPVGFNITPCTYMCAPVQCEYGSMVVMHLLICLQPAVVDIGPETLASKVVCLFFLSATRRYVGALSGYTVQPSATSSSFTGVCVHGVAAQSTPQRVPGGMVTGGRF